jgi:hypothetical protein
MTGISDNLEEFRKLSQIKYKNLIESLEEEYCWKCPMSTNSSETFCREVDSGFVFQTLLKWVLKII